MAAISKSPYYLLYGKEAVLRSNLTIPLLQLAQTIQDDDSSQLQQRIYTMLKLEEDMERAKNIFYRHQQLVKKWFDEISSSDGNFLVRWDK